MMNCDQRWPTDAVSVGLCSSLRHCLVSGISYVLSWHIWFMLTGFSATCTCSYHL